MFCLLCFVFLYLVAYLSSYHVKAIKALLTTGVITESSLSGLRASAIRLELFVLDLELKSSA